MVAEKTLDRAKLNFIAERGRGAMRIDVVDLVGRQLGAAQCVAHRAKGAVAVLGGRGQMVRVARHAVADDFGVDLGIALFGVLVFLKYDNPGAFAHYKAVAILIPRSRGPRRIVVEVGR